MSLIIAVVSLSWTQQVNCWIELRINHFDSIQQWYIMHKMHDKGQLISECPFGVLNFPKLQRKNLAKNLKSGQINKIKALSYNTINSP